MDKDYDDDTSTIKPFRIQIKPKKVSKHFSITKKITRKNEINNKGLDEDHKNISWKHKDHNKKHKKQNKKHNKKQNKKINITNNTNDTNNDRNVNDDITPNTNNLESTMFSTNLGTSSVSNLYGNSSTSNMIRQSDIYYDVSHTDNYKHNKKRGISHKTIIIRNENKSKKAIHRYHSEPKLHKRQKNKEKKAKDINKKDNHNYEPLNINNIKVKFSNMIYSGNNIKCAATRQDKYVHIWSSICTYNLVIKKSYGYIKIKTLHHCDEKLISGTIKIFNKDTNKLYNGIIYNDDIHKRECLLTFRFSEADDLPIAEEINAILQFNIHIHE